MRLSDLEPKFSYHILNELKDTVKYEFKWKTIDGGACTKAITTIQNKDGKDCIFNGDFYNFVTYKNFKGCEVGFSIDKIDDTTGDFGPLAFRVFSARTQALTKFLKEKQSLDFFYFSAPTESKARAYKARYTQWAKEQGWVLFNPEPTQEIINSRIYIAPQEQLSKMFFMCPPQLKKDINDFYFRSDIDSTQALRNVISNSSQHKYTWNVITDKSNMVSAVIKKDNDLILTISILFENIDADSEHIKVNHWAILVKDKKGKEHGKIKDPELLATISEVILNLIRSKTRRREINRFILRINNVGSNYWTYDQLFKHISRNFRNYNDVFFSSSSSGGDGSTNKGIDNLFNPGNKYRRYFYIQTTPKTYNR
jgi:phage-related protein